MTNHPNRNGQFELTFWDGSAGEGYRRNHTTYEQAEAEAYRVLAVLAEMSNRGAHPAIIYGPGLGRDGWTIT